MELQPMSTMEVNVGTGDGSVSAGARGPRFE